MKTWKTKTKDGNKGVVLRTIDRDEHELPAAAFDTTTKHDKDGFPIEVKVPEERFLPFGPAGARVAAKRLYTVKGEKPDGTVIQIPLEGQINNNVASPENAIGLRLYTTRGVNVFFDFETGKAAFCPTWDCWAEWNDELDGFCTEAHKAVTKGSEQEGAFGSGATTSRTWRG